MKRIPAMAITLIAAPSFAQVSVFGYQDFDQQVTQQQLEDAGPLFWQQTVEFPASETFAFGGESDHTVRATDRIVIEEGDFVAGPFTTGQMTLMIDPSPFDVALMDEQELGAIPRFGKMELGVELPEAILEQVDRFVVNAAGDKLNPYLEWELKVQAFFTHPNYYGPIIVDGFYTKEFTSWMVDPLPNPLPEESCSDAMYAALGGYDELPDNGYPFRVRFAPPYVGKWNCTVYITVNESTVIASSPFVFKVVQSDHHGFMKAGASGRYMTLDDATFVPIGCNTPWPETDPNIDYDMAWATHVIQDNAPKMIGESYRPLPAAPRVYDKYKERIVDMYDHGANYFRTIMYPASTEIEWEKKGDYTQRLPMAQEMDEILELAEEKDFFLHWNFQIHYSFQASPQAYYKYWTWTDQNPVTGREYCYRTIVGNDSFDFFTNAEAKKYYKQRLRYILARWGYSPNIAVFELFSEVSNVAPDGGSGNGYYLNQGTSNWTTYRDWQVEMGNYIKSTYNGRKHLLTCNFADSKHKDDDVFYYECFDIMTSNMYDFGSPSWSEFWSKRVSKWHTNLDESSNDNYSYNVELGDFGYNIKPLMYSETGTLNINEACADETIERNRDMWYSLFSGASTLQWSAWYNEDNFEIFGQMRDFMSGIDLDGEHWYPGASKVLLIPGIPPGWEYHSGYADDMFGSGKKADIAYLRSGDGNFAIGMVTNKTFNGKNSGLCSIHDSIWTISSLLETPIIVGTDDEANDLKVRGLNFDKYYINYFLPTNLSTPIHSDDDVGPAVPIRIDIVPSESTYIVLFTIRREGQNWVQEQEHTESAEMMEENRFNSSLVANGENPVETGSEHIRLYPNPVKECMMLDVGNAMKNATLTILSAEGREIFHLKMQGFSEAIDVSSLSPGQYNLMIKGEDHKKVYRKFVKL